MEPVESQYTGPTQPLTQIVVDPRRLGQGGSGLNEEDLADICCILHPASIPAYKATALIHKDWPDYTLCTTENVNIRENNNGNFEDVDTFELAAEGLTPYDIVLRLSAEVRDPLGGFHFGRNRQRCDFVLGRFEESRRVSNIHFRIYINEHGTIMLEDQSTNGTAVDGTLLRGKEKENNHGYRHTLEQGSVIVLTMTPPEVDYRFIVRIPHRDLEADNAYQQNLADYLLRIDNIRQKHAAQAADGGQEVQKTVNLFPPDAPTQRNTSKSYVGKALREWRGGTKYNRVGFIGRGAFAVVYKITAKYDGIPYAAKELEKRKFMKNGILDQKVDMEMRIMQRIKHPNVVQYIEHVDWEDYLYIIMEFVPGGDLGSLINREGHLPESDVHSMAGQLLSALKYLHGEGITHRDVKPDNILINNRIEFQVKLTDFGLSKMIDSEETFLRTFCGTLLYCAPEVYSEYREYDIDGQRNLRGFDKKLLPPQRYGHAVDIWSLAGVLFYSLCGSPPYPVKSGTSYQELLNQIMTQPLDIRPLQRATVSENAIRFVKSMLRTRPEHRATIEELEGTPWFLGGDSFAVSMEEDEVDMIGDDYLDPQLEGGASQLSIQDPDLDDSQDMDQYTSNLTQIQQIENEIPNNFSTSNESYGFMRGSGEAGKNRLFGEVNGSALGSSGALPDELNIPVPAMNFRALGSNISEDSRDTEREAGNLHLPIKGGTRQTPATMRTPKTMLPPPPRLPDVQRYTDADDHFTRSSSLMGAESMVGHLNVHSPASDISPTIDSPGLTMENNRELFVSLRRPREEEEDDCQFPASDSQLPAKRRRKSERVIEIPVPASIFWDPKDKSTHHENYPQMTTSDFKNYTEFAKSKGEKFLPGHKTFEVIMQSFRSSRSPSYEAETRAHSEPTKEEGRRMMMVRDERQLAEEMKGQTSSMDVPIGDEYLPDTNGPSNVSTMSVHNNSAAQFNTHAVVLNDFLEPKRILAKVISTSDSCLPTISLNITEAFTSWGRGLDATVRYSNGHEVRIPKYAFKIFLFKPGHYTQTPKTTQVWTDQDDDMHFYISTKASAGIWVNGVHLQSYDPQKAQTSSRFWGELRHGDVITVWRNNVNLQEVTQFRFECYWGRSKDSRKSNEAFKLVEDNDFVAEMDEACLSQEEDVLTEQRRRAEKDKKHVREEKEKGKLARNDVTTT